MKQAHKTASTILFILFFCLQSLGLQSIFAGQNQVVTVGIVNFTDEGGIGAPPEFGKKIAQDVQRKLVAAYKDLLPRMINVEAGAAPTSLPVEQVAVLGKQSGVKFVIRGGLLSASSEGEATTLQVFADVIAVESASMATLRAEGTASQQSGNIDWTSINFTTGEFRNSALGQALAGAVEQLSAAVYQSIISPVQTANSPQTPDVTQTEAQEVQTASSDEELQQLISQAESLIANGVGNTDSLSALSKSLMNLKTALETKASQLQEAKDTAEIDKTIADRKVELQSAVSTLTQQAATSDSTQYSDQGNQDSDSENQSSSGEKKSMLTKLGEYVGEAMIIMQKIQEMRSLFRRNAESYQQTEYPTNTTGDAQMPTEEGVTEVTGVVTEDGVPVADAIVTESESGATTKTDSSGSYALPVIAGRLAKLLVTKAGKPVATSQVDLLRGRATIADFTLKPQSANGEKAFARIIPATAIVSMAKSKGLSVGTLKGQIKDSQGQPITRALVNLGGFAVARTDSNGQYTFLNVPAGVHRMTVIKSGLNIKNQTVQVVAKKSNETPLQFAANEKLVKPVIRPAVIVRGSGVALRGQVSDGENRAIAGVKITAMQQTSAVSVFTKQTGTFELKDLKPGAYRLLVSKAGFENENQSLNLQTDERRQFRLKKSNPALNQALDFQRAKLVNLNTARRQPEPSRQPARQPSGQLTGRVTATDARIPQVIPARTGNLRLLVVDAKSGRPIFTAIISISGQRPTTTDSSGVFAMTSIQAGTYQLGVRKPGYTNAMGSVVVRAGETTTTTIRLTPNQTPPLRSIPR